MGLENCQYEVTGKVKQELKEKGLPINHNTIQPIMHRWYENNPYWQIPNILRELKKKGLLIVNGCRSFLEVKKLKNLCPLVLIIEIRAKASIRQRRLRLRDGTTPLEFRKIENDEMKVTPLRKILKGELVDVVIMNNGSFDSFKAKAKKIALLISPFKKGKKN